MDSSDEFDEGAAGLSVQGISSRSCNELHLTCPQCLCCSLQVHSFYFVPLKLYYFGSIISMILAA